MLDNFCTNCSLRIFQGVASPRQLKGSNHSIHGYPAQKDVCTSGVERSIIEGVYTHIFVFFVIIPF